MHVLLLQAWFLPVAVQFQLVQLNAAELSSIAHGYCSIPCATGIIYCGLLACMKCKIAALVAYPQTGTDPAPPRLFLLLLATAALPASTSASDIKRTRSPALITSLQTNPQGAQTNRAYKLCQHSGAV